jgi:hypothetical protein
MNKLVCALAFAVPVAIGGIAGAVTTLSEVSGETYRGLIACWPQLPVNLQAQVRHGIIDGKLTRWEWEDVRPHLAGQAWNLFYNFRMTNHESTELEPARAAFMQTLEANGGSK